MTEHEWAADFVKRCRWTTAKTMPKNPHEYIVKGETADPEEYERFFRYIFENHYIEWFWRKPYKMVTIGEYKYWIMTDDISESRIINRKQVTQR